jgi:hypothetical protein
VRSSDTESRVRFSNAISIRVMTFVHRCTSPKIDIVASISSRDIVEVLILA